MDKILLFWQSLDESLKISLISGTTFVLNFLFFWLRTRRVVVPEISPSVLSLLESLKNTNLWYCDRDYVTLKKADVTVTKSGKFLFQHLEVPTSRYERKVLRERVCQLQQEILRQRVQAWQDECTKVLTQLNKAPEQKEGV